MSRRAAPSTHLLVAVRAWFGLDQSALALYLQVSPDLVHAIEAGRRALTPPVQAALLPLLRVLPPPEARAAAQAAAEVADAPLVAPALAAPAALPGSPAPEAAELDFRRRQCLHRASRCLAQAAALAQQARLAQRWQAALPALLAAAEVEATTAADPEAAARATDHAAWLASWLHHRARPLAPAAATRWHRLRAQATGLLAEAAALAGTAGSL